MSKFKDQYQSTLNFFLKRQTKREDIIKALPHTLEIIDTLADNLLDPTKKIEFKELSKLTTEELTEIKDSLRLIAVVNKREGRQTPIFDAVKENCAKIIDTLIENKGEAKKNRSYLSYFFSAIRKTVRRIFKRPLTSDLSPDANKIIEQKFKEIKNILAPQNESVREETDQEIANILKNNTDKLRNLNVVGAQNSGGNSSGGMSAEANLTFFDGQTQPKPNPGPPKSEPNTTLAGPTLTEPSLTPRQKEIEKELKNLNPGTSMPSKDPLKPGLPKLTGRRVGSLPLRQEEPSTSPKSQRTSSHGQSLAERMIEELRKNDPNSREADKLEKATRYLIGLGKQKKLQRPPQRRIDEGRKPGKGGVEITRQI